MGVSRSGYYKWRKRDKSTRDLRREEVIALVSEVHKAHPSHGYRWVAAFIRVNYQQDISDNYGNTAQKSRRDTARSDIIRPWINR